MPIPLVLVFARAPQMGKVKTRLANEIGDKEALGIYMQLLRKTDALLQASDLEAHVYWAGGFPSKHLHLFNHLPWVEQQGKDLGERMAHATQQAFEKKYSPVILIGTDCPQLQPHHLGQACAILEKKAYVLGPCHDGGYYLLGMRTFSSLPFTHIPWGSDQVLARSIQRIGQSHCSFLETLHDIDHAKDLVHAPELAKKGFSYSPSEEK